MSNKGIFEGLTYDQDRFALFPRCYGRFLAKTPEGAHAGCTLSAFWVGLGFEPIDNETGFRHPISKEVYSNNGLVQQTDKLALDYNVVPDNALKFTNAIMNNHDQSTSANRSHEYTSMQLINKLVDKAGLRPTEAIPAAISTKALQALLNK